MSAALRIGILEGDDIGHEIVPAAVAVARAAAERHGVAIDWQRLPIGRRALDSHGHTLPPSTLDALPTLDGWILGPIGHRAYPKGPNAINPHPILRKQFNLFANVRPTRSYPDIGCLHDGVDLVIVRENNEGFQPDRNMLVGSGEFRPTDEVSLSVRVITRTGSRRVARAAFELARQRRKHLTVVHKDTVFKLSCGMFVEECQRVAADYPDVTVDDVIVDTFAMRLVRDPQSFDVVVTTNLFGDILSDEAPGGLRSCERIPHACSCRPNRPARRLPKPAQARAVAHEGVRRWLGEWQNECWYSAPPRCSADSSPPRCGALHGQPAPSARR